MARSTARKRALNTLYEADQKGQEILALLDERIAYPGAETPLPDYAVEIIRGVAGHRRTIDKALNEHSTGWDVKRMAVVDRNIARIAAWEIVYNDEVPAAVAIDEALHLAKSLSDAESPSFLHGLLSAIEANVSSIKEEEIAWQEMRAKEAAEAENRVVHEADEAAGEHDVDKNHYSSINPQSTENQ